MRTVLLESLPGAGAGTEAALIAAGHEVTRCHEPGQPGFPCVGLSGKPCPLDGPEGADVVLVVRTLTEPDPTATEIGVTCASRRGIPVAVLDESGSEVFGAFATTVPPGTDPVVACESAIAADRARRAAQIADELAPVLGATPEVEVRGRPDRVRIEVRVPSDAPLSDEAIATRAHARYRLIDAAASGVDVDVHRD